MSSAAQRLRELEQAKLEFSRNAHFELFQDQENARALRLRRWLAALGRLLALCASEGTVELAPRPGGAVELRLGLPRLRVLVTEHLGADELALLRREPGAAEALAAYGGPS